MDNQQLNEYYRRQNELNQRNVDPKGNQQQSISSPPQQPPQPPAQVPSDPNTTKELRLNEIVQQLYLAQAQVQIEANEIQRAQMIASTAQHELEEATNNVKVITSALHSAQENVEVVALRAHTAQLQLAAHDQLLFTARQRVDGFSAEMVGLQAELGVTMDTKNPIDVTQLVTKLNEPLGDDAKPKPFSINCPSSSMRNNV